MTKGLQAVLFDMDGLLIDSEPQWFAAETATVAQLGGDWGKQQQLDLLGTNLEVAAAYMIRWTNSDKSHADVMSLLEQNMTEQLHKSVTFRPGAMDLLKSVDVSDLRLGLVTSSTRSHVNVVLEHLPKNLFDVSVTADDVEFLKPHPLPYLTAMQALGSTPSRTVVLEDSPPGIESGEAAGCHVVAVPSVAAIPDGPNRTVVPTLTDITIDWLRELAT